MTIEELELQTKSDFDALESEKSRLSKENDALDIKTKKYSHYGRNLIYMGFAAFLLPIICLFIPYDIKLNEYGDYAGGVVASLWSLAGFVFIYVAFLAQKQQLMMQQFELKHTQFETKSTRLEIMKQEKQMQQQNDTLSLQRFENTFFQLLQFHNEIVKAMIVYDGENDEQVIGRGRDMFTVFYEDLNARVLKEKINKFFPNGKVLKAELKVKMLSAPLYVEEYRKLFLVYQNDLGHYFRSLIQIVRFVDEAEESIEKKRYIRIIRAQLSMNELLVLFYNCLTDKGRDFKPLIEKYAIFKSLDTELLLKKEHYVMYDRSAGLKV